jgi:16S rRNA (cytidine1402-2'-O)-methyltransferase
VADAPLRGVLYVVATPIGHLGDLSPRAAETLRSVARVAAEDTRRTRGLLTHLGISGKPIDRLDAHASGRDIERLVEHLARGEDVALVTDAGTPVVSDPGTDLVRAAAEAGVRVVPIPGPSAVMAAISATGLCTGAFRFLGFLPRKGPERRDALEVLRATPETVVFFESPERTAETLADLALIVPDRSGALARELTKMHEEILRGSFDELARLANERETLGEVTIVIGPAIAGAGEAAERVSDEEIDRMIDEGFTRGRRAKDIADEVALVSGRPRREIYTRAVARKRDTR